MKSKTNNRFAINLSARLNNLLIFRSAFGGLLIFLIFQSINAQEQWRVFTMQNSPLPSNLITSVAIDTNNVKWIGSDSCLAKIDGNNWTIYRKTNSPLPTNGAGVSAIDSLNHYWLSCYGGGLVKFDGANNWVIYDTNNSPIPTNFVIHAGIDFNNVKWICTTNKGLVKFEDTTWTVFDTNNSGLVSNFTWTIEIHNKVKWVGTFMHGINRYDDTSWITYNYYNSGLPSDVIKGLTIDNSENLWVATQFGGIAKFNYSLNQWTIYNSTNSGLPSNNTFTILVDGYKKWVGMQGAGLAYFNDTNWTVFTPTNSPLPGYSVLGLGLDSNKNLWICCSGGLAIYNPDGIVGVNSIISNLPSNFVLYQNYPNPFNPSTTIKYELPNDGMITFKIYDILGKEIYSTNEFKKAGIYSITFDGSRYASGIYLYRLESGSYTETKKMVLVK